VGTALESGGNLKKRVEEMAKAIHEAGKGKK